MKGYAVYRCTSAGPDARWQPLDLVRTVGEAKYMARHDAEVQGVEIVGWESLSPATGQPLKAWLGTLSPARDPEPGSTYLIAELELPLPRNHVR